MTSWLLLEANQDVVRVDDDEPPHLEVEDFVVEPSVGRVPPLDPVHFDFRADLLDEGDVLRVALGVHPVRYGRLPLGGREPHVSPPCWLPSTFWNSRASPWFPERTGMGRAVCKCRSAIRTP